MAHNEKLTLRVRKALEGVRAVKEMTMFRGVAFMVRGNMCVSTGNDELMVRFDRTLHDDVVSQEGCRPMIMKGREYRGYVYVKETSISTKKELDYWIQLALSFNKTLAKKK